MHADHFQPETIIAAGPSAKVYRGMETATGRKVLIKVLLQDFDARHPLDREKLQLLAPTLLQVRHPQIAGLITLLPTEEEFALVYEFMPGMNAKTFAAERQPTPADVRALAVQLMHALLVGEHLRQPHGDPKPSNLIIADHPGGGLFLQVQDWGLSLTRDSHPHETMWFRAPELHAGGRPTTQSDLFTAAASLFCVATNSAPTQHTEVDEIMTDWHAFNADAVLRLARPDLDQPLREWLAWLLNLAPQQRPQSVTQALDVLMLSMQSGFTYQQQQMPAMAPEAPAPAPVVAAAPPNNVPQSNAPKPKPIVAKSASTATAPKAATAALAAKKPADNRPLIAVVLSLVSIAIVGYFFLPSITGSGKTEVAETKKSSAAATKQATPAATGPGLRGRYVRVELPGIATLNLAEVQVFSGDVNIALKGSATQSSMAWEGLPELAIDGNTNGDKGASKSVMHTDDKKNNPWWQLDLGSEMPLQKIVLWNRTDGDYGERTTNFTVKVLSAQQKVVWEKKGLPKPAPSLKLVPGE